MKYSRSTSAKPLSDKLFVRGDPQTNPLDHKIHGFPAIHANLLALVMAEDIDLYWRDASMIFYMAVTIAMFVLATPRL